VIKTTHRLGDRRDHFESIGDVWQLFEVLLDERKRREIDPTLKALRETSAELAKEHGKVSPGTAQRLKEMKDFFEVMDAWFNDIRRLPLATRVKLVTMGSNLRKWLG
jgi:DNA-binding transcriptional regulator GbsR (MarR family)